MRFWKHTLLTAGIFMGIVTMVTYTSCSHDSCRTLMCRNGGTCSDEACKCPDGYEGNQCETISRIKFYGKYDGITKINALPTFRDSAFVFNETGDTTNRGITTMIYSRSLEMFSGRVLKNEVIVTSTPGKAITYKMIGENKIEVLIDETVDGERILTNFQGTKR